MASDWRAQGEAKRLYILGCIPKKWRLTSPVPPASELRDVTEYIRQFLSPREIEITETDAVDIVAQTSSGHWTAVEVAEAFCHRAALAHQLVSCLHEFFVEATLEGAAKLDAYLAKHKTPVGPLHGLPISLKDQFHVKGVETTMGYIGWMGTFQGRRNDPRHKNEESELVRELRNLGAVLYCKTSVPTTLMAGETANNIIGYTQNPRSRLLSSGGSSGGEGALIALRGSPGGFGSDIGGSVRSPSGYNALYGLLPSPGRVPYQGAANSIDGQSTILSVIGPIAPSAQSLELLFKVVLSQQPWYHDPLVLEIPWRDEHVRETRALIERARPGKPSLAFGVFSYDGVARIHPPIARGFELVERTLLRLGHKMIRWNPPSHARAHEIVAKTFDMDDGTDLRHHLGLSGEPRPKQVIVCDSRPELKASEIAALNVAKREYEKEYMDYWNSTAALTETGRPVDGVLCPIAPHAAAIPEHYRSLGYTSFVNLLGYTSVVIPVTFADKEVDVRAASRLPSNSEQFIDWEYDADTYHGAPVGLQIVGRRLQEKMLTLAHHIGEEVARDARRV
ncbi:hypothetical protein N7492_005751 [Penicillium capsulatum]|uniref:amidase n=1 Tax=Penicillium capsulatum TaxID=69766 RepID=A0A9W9ICF6_9EURO|nr:hypothetical protein N7492_005751 [Penicillium capsulatum]KAJ6135149.1 hypothetical protein N7512_000309 [Penicillium capsulatum]